MKYIKHILLSLVVILTLSGCSMKGIEYSPNFNSINELKDSDLNQMKVKKNSLNSF